MTSAYSNAFQVSRSRSLLLLIGAVAVMAFILSSYLNSCRCDRIMRQGGANAERASATSIDSMGENGLAYDERLSKALHCGCDNQILGAIQSGWLPENDKVVLEGINGEQLAMLHELKLEGSINLYRCDLTQPSVARFFSGREISVIILVECKTNAATWAAIQSASGVKALILCGVEIDGEQFGRVISAHADTLQVFGTGYAALRVDDLAIERLSQCANLEKVYLSGSTWKSSTILSIARLPRLRLLYVGCAVPDAAPVREYFRLHKSHSRFEVSEACRD